MPINYDLKEPCGECPFRKNSMRGWLGTYTPEGVVQAARNDQIFLCHPTVDYEQPDWQEVAAESDKTQHCAGMLIFMNKMFKMSREPEVLAAQNRLGKDHDILFPPQAFIDHHTVTKPKKKRARKR